MSRVSLFILTAAICFAVAVLSAVGAIATNYDGWLAGGLLAYMLALLIGYLPPRA